MVGGRGEGLTSRVQLVLFSVIGRRIISELRRHRVGVRLIWVG